MKPLKWYHYVAAFFAGLFFTNAVPHFVNGVSGNPFPSPFADPPGKGLSSPLVNVLWGSFNLLIGYVLLTVSQLSSKNKLLLGFFFIGIVVGAVMSSIVFADKYKI